jgi:hypothetical protein
LSIFISENQLISSLNFASSFIHLESLVLSSIEPEILRLILSQLTSLPRLFSLTINTEYISKDLTDIYQLIFQLPKLKYMNFLIWEYQDSTTTVSSPISTYEKFSPIEYFVINHPSTFNEVFAIISYTPQLRHLKLMEIKDNDSDINNLSPITLVNLTSLYMNTHDITFDKFEIFIKKLPSKLKVLSFASLSEDMTYLDANRWEKFILKYQPNLEKFYLKYSVFYDNKHRPPAYHGNKNEFISPFWIDRQWIYEAEIESYEIIYSIRPYKYSSKHFYL